MVKTLGILGLHGNYYEHQHILTELNVPSIIVKYNYQFDNIDGLIIPGGESTVIIKMIKEHHLHERLYQFIIIDKKPTMGTCAGAIILSKYIQQDKSIISGFIPAVDIIIERNSYGSQLNSFMKKIDLKFIGNFNCMFIRAPKIIQVNQGEILGYDNDQPIIVRFQNIILCTFHPELENFKIHQFFIDSLLE
jgi:pyridoxal 5'-phosphate synthase pdxT subunit